MHTFKVMQASSLMSVAWRVDYRMAAKAGKLVHGSRGGYKTRLTPTSAFDVH